MCYKIRDDRYNQLHIIRMNYSMKYIYCMYPFLPHFSSSTRDFHANEENDKSI